MKSLLLLAVVFLRLIYTGSTTIQLGWMLPGGDVESNQVDSYRVFYNHTIRECGSRSRVMHSSVILAGADYPIGYTLSNLEEDSDYTIYLVAITGDGIAHTSNLTRTTTLEGGMYDAFPGVWYI